MKRHEHSQETTTSPAKDSQVNFQRPCQPTPYTPNRDSTVRLCDQSINISVAKKGAEISPGKEEQDDESIFSFEKEREK